MLPAYHWIDVPGSSLWMGGGPRSEENPRHRVTIGAYRLGRTPVTRSLYQTFLDATGHESAPFWAEEPFSHPDAPAVGASWEDAVAFCRWYSVETAQDVGLPTEAEWECAAKASREVIYPWGDDEPESIPDYGRRWVDGPEPVDAYPSRHPWGLLGLGENVHEWCADWYDRDYYQVSPATDPTGPESGRRRSSRGGAWRHAVKVSRCAARSSIPPHFRYADYGFRLRSPSACHHTAPNGIT